MSDLWDGDSLADWIGQRLTEEGFAPFGIGVPFTARRAVCEFLRDFEFANDVATCVSMDLNTVTEVLTAAAELIEEEMDA